MRQAPSLALRLSIYLLTAQIIGAVLTTLAIELFVEDEQIPFLNKNRNVLATPRIYDLLIGSIRLNASGALIIAPTEALRREMARTPALMVAAFHVKTNEPLPGSHPQLIDALGGKPRIHTTHVHFTLENEAREGATGHFSLATTPYGPLMVASYGHVYKWIDLLLSLQYEIVAYLRYFAFETLAAVGVGWLAFKRGLKPLEQAAREAERIDMNSLHQRLPLDGVPAEASSLVASFNHALERLDEGAERQRRFLANAAHELRTPVAILMERLDEPGDAPPVAKLRRDAERIRNIVEQLLATVRLDQKDAGGDECVDLDDFVKTMVDDHALLAVKMRKSIAFENGAAPQNVTASRFALQSVCANLIHNALRAEPVGGTVIVRLAAGASVEVVDHGDGIAASDHAAIFEPFWRKSENTPGTGLGLAIARELIRKLGGVIDVGETPGGGATFRVRLHGASGPHDSHSKHRRDIP
jgi:signal transduction histidine kinase